MREMSTTLTAGATRPAERPVPAAPIRGAAPSRVYALLQSGVAWGLFVSVLLVAWVLLPLDGLAYYTTPTTRRGYAVSHALLKPSGPFGQTFGVVGTMLLLVPFLYMLKKRLGARRGVGTTKGWLEVHLFCGIVGPVLVTFHTSFKFNGIVSTAYWSMAAVMLSGFVGRYLYVRIPRSLKGAELTRAELDERADRLHTEVLSTAGGSALLDRIGRLEQAAVPQDGRLSWFGLLFGEIGVRRKLKSLERDVQRSTLSRTQQIGLLQLVHERVFLLRRTAYLQRTKTAFGLWHIFHLPLVYLMLVIAVLHIGIVLYMGYIPFLW
jgi:hypothetical protein